MSNTKNRITGIIILLILIGLIYQLFSHQAFNKAQVLSEVSHLSNVNQTTKLSVQPSENSNKSSAIPVTIPGTEPYIAKKVTVTKVKKQSLTKQAASKPIKRTHAISSKYKKWRIQIASFKYNANAKRLVRKLNKKKIDTEIIKSDKRYKVFLKIPMTLMQAKTKKLELESDYKLNVILIKDQS